MTRPSTIRGLQIVLLYIPLAGTWILSSDQVMGWLFQDPTYLVLASTLIRPQGEPLWSTAGPPPVMTPALTAALRRALGEAG